MNTREIPIALIANAIKRELSKYKGDGLGLHPTCLSCRLFDEAEGEICKLAGVKPPARVIAFACEKYQDTDDIPF